MRPAPHDDYERMRRDRTLAYEQLPIDDEEWQLRSISRQPWRAAASSGVGIPELLITATAERHRVDVLHYDRDVEHVAAITGQRMHWVVPPGAVP